ncbi:putative short chain dehydrogenase/ reductase [Xylogone sp. PMI_703]|nr:putative short chain dehydrogenase/ reductase [Xylogone sp. PMI_703]
MFRRIRDKFIPEPLPPADTFQDQTVLITGGTSGLGLVSAIHFANLGADVIITCRNASRGELAKDSIERATRIKGRSKVQIMELDMSRYSSCVEFVEELKGFRKGKGGLDVVILNAGIMTTEFVESPEGWEETIQINTLNTTLLGLLLLPWMKEERVHRETPAHLVFVSSKSHLDADIASWAKWAKNGGVLRHCSKRENWSSGVLSTPSYDNSKLFLMYAVEEICKQALGPDGEPQVIVNSVCPGLVYTDIARTIVSQSLLMKLGVPLYLGGLGKSADYGARFYVSASLTSKQEHASILSNLMFIIRILTQ